MGTYITPERIVLQWQIGQITAESVDLQGFARYICEAKAITEEVVRDLDLCAANGHIRVLTCSDLPPGYEDTWVVLPFDATGKAKAPIVMKIQLCGRELFQTRANNLSTKKR